MSNYTLPFSKPVKSDHNLNFWYFQNNHIKTTKIFSVRSSPDAAIFKVIAVRSSPDAAKIRFIPDPVRSSPDPCSSLKQWYVRKFAEVRNFVWHRFAGWVSGKTTAFKQEPDTDPDIPNALIDISRMQTSGKSSTLHNHSFIIFRSIFSASCAMTPSLSMV